MKKPITIADLVMGAGAAVTFIFSFLRFVSFPGGGRNAWSSDAFAFASTVPAILAIVLAAWIALDLAGVKLPDHVLTYNPAQLKGTWGIGAGGIMLSWLTVDFGGFDKGAGFWLMLIGSLAMAVGAVMALLGKGTETVGAPGGSGLADAAPPAPPAPPPPPPPPAV